MRGVVDRDSDIVYYEIGATEAKTTSALSRPDRLETFPAWSPDGRTLYFSSGPVLWPDEQHGGLSRVVPRITPPLRYDEALYDLMRIPYDVDSDTWGECETVVPSKEAGQSALLPRVSPDGRYVLFCMCKYGCFPIAMPSSDLYLMELETGEYWPLDLNSEWAESWHSWSSNSRWFAFSSKRRDGLFSRIYLSYVDEGGQAHKPVLVPEKDPTFYESFLRTRNTPELITASAAGWSEKLLAAHESPQVIEVTMPAISMAQREERVPIPAPLD
jgi:dipeptidyl aminopeptidase/acylaminoacyl peptidase